MKNLKRKFLSGLLFTSFVLNPALYAPSYTGGHTGTPVSAKISSPKTTIDMGEPLIIKLTYKFKEPQINAETGDVYSNIRHPLCLLIEIKDNDNDWLAHFPDYTPFENEGIKYFPLELQSLSLNVQDKEGLEYSVYSMISYNYYKKSLVFDEPGTYKFCTIATAKKDFSNVIDIRLTSQMQEEKAALFDQNVCDLLMGFDRSSFNDPNYRSKIMVKLKNIVEEFPNSLLSKLAAARLGLEGVRDDRREKYEAIREKREPSRPLYQEAKVYLQIGLDLPDDFFVRQKILYELMEIEMKNKNYSKAISYVEELGVKYPKGKYGKEAASGKAEVLELQKRELAQAPQPRMSGWSRLLPLFLVIAAGIVLIGLILVLKKKPSSRGKSRAM